MRAHHQTQHHRQWRRTRLCGDRRHDTHRHAEGTQGCEHLLHRVRPRKRRRQDRPGPTGHVHLQRRPGLIHHVPAHGFDRPEAHQRPRRRSGAGRPLRARGQRAHAAARLRPRVHRRGRRRILRDPRRGQAGTVVGGRRRRRLQRVHQGVPEQTPPLELAQIRARRILRHHARRGARIPAAAGRCGAERTDAHLQRARLHVHVRPDRRILRRIFPVLCVRGEISRPSRVGRQARRASEGRPCLRRGAAASRPGRRGLA